MWDAEADGSTVPRLVQLTSAFRNLGGNPRLVYLPHWWWQQIGSPDLTPLARAGLSLISSDYTSYSDNGPGWTPYGGMTPVIWQYTDAQPFNGQSVDFNAYKGTVDELRVLLGINPAPQPQEEDMPYLVIIDPTIPGHANAQWQMSNGVTSRQFPGDIKYRNALPSVPRTFITTASGSVPSWASGASVYRLADGEDPVAVQAGLCGPVDSNESGGGSGGGGLVAHTHDVGSTGPAVATAQEFMVVAVDMVDEE
jgi:hypothetical protein